VTGFGHHPILSPVRRLSPATGILLALALALVLFNAVLAWSGTLPLWTDEAHHLRVAARFATLMGGHGSGGEPAGPEESFLTVEPRYPPLITLTTGILFRVVGFSAAAGRFLVSLFWPLLLLSLYGIGRRLGWARSTSLAVALAPLLCPQLLHMSRRYMLDFPLTAMCMASVWALLATDGLKKRGASVRFGIVLGLCMLTKWTAPQFIALPLLWVAAGGWRKPGVRTNLLLALAAAAAVAATWYLPNLATIFGKLVSDGLRTTGPAVTGQHFPSLGQLEAWVSNGRILAAMVPGALLLLLLVSCSRALVERSKDALFPLVWLVATYLFVTLLPPREPRFLVPMIPVVGIAALAAVRMEVVRRSWKRELALALLVAAMLLTFGYPELLKPRIVVSPREVQVVPCESP